MATNETIKEITNKLEEGVKRFANSDEYKEYLQFMAKFYSYSFNNSFLIWLQNPMASLVAGYKTWQTKFKRQVRKGEKGITILAPCPHKYQKEVLAEDGTVESKEVSWMGFKAVKVFDISQTDGEEVPSSGVKELSGNAEGYEELMQKLTDYAKIPVEYMDIETGAKGYFSPKEKKIVLKSGMSQLQTLKTMIHETAHSKLHGDDGEQSNADRNTMEVQAESVAYTVCSYLGLDTSDYSFGYVTGWSTGKEVKELTESMEVIRKTAQEIIEAVA